MGLDATVMCNCFRDGKTTPAPFPRDWLELNQEGYINLKKEHESTENWIKYDAWEQSCCEHDGMDFVSEHISNWGGYRQFQAALGWVGWEHFPILEEQLPNTNGGLTAPVASAEALLELDFFSSYGEIGTTMVLVDTASDEALYESIAAYGGLFLLSGRLGVNVGLSEFDFFAVDAASGLDLFRATRFRQFNTSGKMLSGDGDGVAWQDLDTGDVYESGIAIHGKQTPWGDGRLQTPDGKFHFDYPSEFHVERRPLHVTAYDYVVRALRTVFSASVETGNPVRWC